MRIWIDPGQAPEALAVILRSIFFAVRTVGVGASRAFGRLRGVNSIPPSGYYLAQVSTGVEFLLECLVGEVVAREQKKMFMERPSLLNFYSSKEGFHFSEQFGLHHKSLHHSFMSNLKVSHNCERIVDKEFCASIVVVEFFIG